MSFTGIAPRKALAQLHVWGGLIVTAPLALAALTGAILLFRPDFSRLELTARDAARPRLALDRLMDAARAAHPASTPVQVRVSPDLRWAVCVMFADRELIFLHPQTGVVVHRGNYYGGFFGQAEYLHRLVFWGEAGKVLMGTAAIAFLILFASGLVLLRSWRSVRLPRRAVGRGRWLLWHRWIGGVVGAATLVSATTGVPIAFSWAKAMLGDASAALTPRRPMDKSRLGEPSETLERALKQLIAVEPGAEQFCLLFPKSSRDPLTAFYIAPDAPHPNARSFAWFDESGRMLRQLPFAAAPTGDRAFYRALSLHFGQFWSGFGRVPLFLGCATLLVLVITGAWSWWVRS